ncbi:MAG: succinylglutamate desuccinylase/aspartoacylase family protein [Clostridia bacterium]|nr:succinylglutamate desuccinylase/aspartoacylase family protein [Clostridia bacterium]
MDTWSICGNTLSPGEKRQTVLRVPMGGQPHDGRLPGRMAAEDDYEIPATLICGAAPGKTLLISASIHSGEYVGIPAVIRTARALDPRRMKGCVVLLHCVNLSGVLTHSYRFVPEDGFNLNSGYPGRADGTVGERLAAWFVRELFPNVDFILDLHGGSPEEAMTPLFFFPCAKKVRAASLAAAKATNVPYTLESRAMNGEYSYAATTFGIPGLLLERGSGLFCTEAEVRAEQDDIRLLLDHLGIYPAEPGTFNAGLQRRTFRDTVYLESDIHGLWYPAVEKDADVKKGQLLGRTEDYFGNILQEYYAAADGHVVYYTRGLAVRPGDALVTYVLLASEE